VFNFIYITAAIPVIETNPDNVIEKQSGNIIDLKTNMLYIYMCVIFLTFFFFCISLIIVLFFFYLTWKNINININIYS